MITRRVAMAALAASLWASAALGASPTMSPAPGSNPTCGTPGLDLCTPGADVFANFPTVAPSAISGMAALGLVPGDVINSFSWGNEVTVGPSAALLRFSVDPASIGGAGAVVGEAASGEAFADIFNGGPTLGPGFAILEADGDGLPASMPPALGFIEAPTAPPLDDVTALATCDAAHMMGAPAFFTLAPGSPTLITLGGASAADILAVASFGAGAPPVVFMPFFCWACPRPT